MKVLIDLNVVLDFLQRREPFFEEAANVMDAVLYKRVEGVLAAHAITTVHYFLAKGAVNRRVGETLRWLLETFEVVPCDKETLLSALTFELRDYEDAVTGVSALRSGCSCIVTRNAQDFAGLPVSALSPSEYLEMLDSA